MTTTIDMSAVSEAITKSNMAEEIYNAFDTRLEEIKYEKEVAEDDAHSAMSKATSAIRALIHNDSLIWSIASVSSGRSNMVLSVAVPLPDFNCRITKAHSAAAIWVRVRDGEMKVDTDLRTMLSIIPISRIRGTVIDYEVMEEMLGNLLRNMISESDKISTYIDEIVTLDMEQLL